MKPKQTSQSPSRLEGASPRVPVSEEVAGIRDAISLCDTVSDFCYQAQSIVNETLAKAGVKEGLIQRLSVRPTDGGLSVMELSADERMSIRQAAFEALQASVPQYNSNFPDFIGYAQSLDKRVASAAFPSADRADRIVKVLVDSISAARQKSETSEQANTNYILLSGLLAVTKGRMPHHHEHVRFALYGVDSERGATCFRDLL